MQLGTPVGELQRRMTSREFTYWIAYANLNPFGPLYDDYRAGVVASQVAATGGVAASPSSFFESLRRLPPSPADVERENRRQAMILDCYAAKLHATTVDG